MTRLTLEFEMINVKEECLWQVRGQVYEQLYRQVKDQVRGQINFGV